MESYLAGFDEARFLADQRTQDAVIRCIECIGEASGKIIERSGPEQFPELELVQAYWARNRFSHGYYDLNMSRVWQTATVSIPKLAAGARRAIETIDGR